MSGGSPQQSDSPAPEPQARRYDPRQGLIIGRPFGIPVYVSPYLILVAAVLVVLYGGSAGGVPGTLHGPAARYGVAAAFVILLYASVLLHELSHSVVARAFRLPVRRIVLYPLGGFSVIEPEPPTPGQEFLVSAAGPAMSLVIAGAAYLVLRQVHSTGVIYAVLYLLVLSNLLVTIFNLLPGLPLDGGRVLRAGLWKLTGNASSATVMAAWAGRALAVALVAVPLVDGQGIFGIGGYGLWLIVVAIFMWMSASQSLRSAKIREKLPMLQARTLARRAIPIQPTLPLAEAIRRADLAQARALVVVDHDSKPIAIVNENAVLATPEQRRPWVDAGSLARTLDDGMILSADLSGMDLIEAVSKVPASEYLLVEPSGQVYGVLSRSDLDLAFSGV
jgi:Zn-dependent protease/CBS domain-containing protein